MGIKKISLTYQILISLILAVIVGISMQNCCDIASSFIKPFGNIFLNLLKFIVVPMVLFSIMGGIVSIKDIRKVGSIGLQTLILFTITTIIATAVGILGGISFKQFFPIISKLDFEYNPSSSSNFLDVIVDIFPSNFVFPLLNSSMLQVIVIAILIGFSVILSGEKANSFVRMIDSCNIVFSKCMEIILKLSPIGVFCLLCPVVAFNGPTVIGSLTTVIIVTYICYILHMVIVYSLLVKSLGNVSPLKFFKEQFPTMIFAFSSASSIGTIPINLQGCKRLKIPDNISSFVVPIGATIHMDGTAIYQGVCVIFIASCYGINLTLSQMVTIVLTTTLASVGTAGVPGAGTVMLTMALASIGLPAEGISIVMGVDRIFDMGRTVVNTSGDAACALIISKLTKKNWIKVEKEI